MSDAVQNTFFAYTDLIWKKLRKEFTTYDPFTKHSPDFLGAVLDRLALKYEDGSEFKALVLHTEPTVDPKYWRYMGGNSVKAFFRRSGVYRDLASSRVPDLNLALDSYRASFARKTRTVTYAAPIEYLCLETKELQFKTFSIRQFTEPEFTEFFQQTCNPLFYRDAILKWKDVQGYWWLICNKEEPLQTEPCNFHHYERYQANLEITTCAELELPMQIMALYRWGKNHLLRDYLGDGVFGMCWIGPQTPFHVILHDNLLESPETIQPNTHLLLKWDRPDDEGNEIRGPADYQNLDAQETERFHQFILKMESIIQDIATVPEWHFALNGLKYLLKAMLSKEQEQLLWHLVVIESLLGQKGEPITESISRRLSYIHGNRENKRTAIRRQFKELYDFRCDLIHGNQSKKKVYEDHIDDARFMARKTIAWYLNFLHYIYIHYKNNNVSTRYPGRRDLLMLLDAGPSKAGFSSLFSALSKSDFPYMPEWVE